MGLKKYPQNLSHYATLSAHLYSMAHYIFRMTKIKELRASRPNTLLLDGGDQFQGTFWFHVFGGEATSYFMKKLGYDAMVSNPPILTRIASPRRHCGSVVRALATGAEGFEFKTQLVHGIFLKHSSLSSMLGKVMAVRRRSGTPPHLRRYQYKLALYLYRLTKLPA